MLKKIKQNISNIKYNTLETRKFNKVRKQAGKDVTTIKQARSFRNSLDGNPTYGTGYTGQVGRFAGQKAVSNLPAITKRVKGRYGL